MFGLKGRWAAPPQTGISSRYAEIEARRIMDALRAGEPQQLARHLLRKSGENDKVWRLEQDGEDGYQELLSANSTRHLDEVSELALNLVLDQPDVVTVLHKLLTVVQQKAQSLTNEYTRDIANKERSAGDIRAKGGGLFGGAFRGPLGELTELVVQGQRQAVAREARLAADSMGAVVALLAKEIGVLAALQKQRVALVPIVYAAILAISNEIQTIEASISTSPVPNDLPSGYERHLATALAAEDASIAQAEARRSLVNAVGEAEETDQHLSGDKLLRVVTAQALPAVAGLPRSVEEALSKVAMVLDMDGQVVWRAVLRHLGIEAITRSPGVRLTSEGKRAKRAYAFQVSPIDQQPGLKGHMQIRPAHFYGEGPTTRLGVLLVQTGFELSHVEGYERADQELRESEATLNHYVIPDLAKPATGTGDGESEPRPGTGPSTRPSNNQHPSPESEEATIIS